TRVIPARLYGRRLRSGSEPAVRPSGDRVATGTIEVFLTRWVNQDVWEALVRPGRKMPVGERVEFGEGELAGGVVACGEGGLRTIRLDSRSARTVSEHVENLGHVPLPPYIDRPDESSDRERYQTVFAKEGTAVAAPTAGLHFSPEILEAIRKRGA